MRAARLSFVAIGLLLASAWLIARGTAADPPVADPAEAKTESAKQFTLPEAKPIPDFVHKSLGWLVEAQHKDGGWGGGSHTRQDVRDPHQVPTDPATTSFAALALLRAGHTPAAGSYQEAVRRATIYLVDTVEKSQVDGPRITTITGTQPQSKLGQLVDTSMTAQYLARVLSNLPPRDALRQRVDRALEKCLRKLEVAQSKDGSWSSGGGWAPVLQSSLSCSALEIAQAAGKKVDRQVLENARKYQKDNVHAASGKAATKAAAGVELYAFSGAQRANAADARAADELVREAKQQGRVETDAPVSAESLLKAGAPKEEAEKLAKAVVQNGAQVMRLGDEGLLRGFGNNGGEEFVSFVLTSESLVITGGDAWEKWNDKMHTRLAKIQNPDGSWSGHHCITSPVFCTAAVIQCLTADRDAKILVAIADAAAKRAKQTKTSEVQ